mgnify:CR=1 FL=1
MDIESRETNELIDILENHVQPAQGTLELRGLEFDIDFLEYNQMYFIHAASGLRAEN